MENEYRQTAMESHLQWLYDNQVEMNIPIAVIEDAKDKLELEKLQIIEAHNTGKYIPDRKGTDYYDENFKPLKN